MTAVTLRALGWDHPRCVSPMRACGREWARRGEAEIAWEWRSLGAFGDEPLEQVADRFDLLVIDHPFCGTAAATGVLRPLDELLSADSLAAIGDRALGSSQRSYQLAGHTWALAADAAAQVSAFNGSSAVAGDPPQSWPEAVAVVRALARRAAVPLAPAHALCSLLTLWAATGQPAPTDEQLVDPDAGLEAVEWLVDMHRDGHPAATGWEPPQVLEAIARGDLDYMPLGFGYVSYSSTERDRGCRFADLPGVHGSVLGGAGLAVSAASRHPEAAASFAAWVCGEPAQRELVASHGGQPAAAGCWSDPELDRSTGGFYSATRATTQAAWVRPTDAWWPAFQLAGGEALTAALEARRSPAAVLADLLTIHRDHTRSAAAR